MFNRKMNSTEAQLNQKIQELQLEVYSYQQQLKYTHETAALQKQGYFIRQQKADLYRTLAVQGCTLAAIAKYIDGFTAILEEGNADQAT